MHRLRFTSCDGLWLVLVNRKEYVFAGIFARCQRRRLASRSSCSAVECYSLTSNSMHLLHIRARLGFDDSRTQSCSDLDYWQTNDDQ